MVFLKRFPVVLFVLFSMATEAKMTGQRWRVEMTPEGATIPHHIDQLRFQKELFFSSIFERRGFPGAQYFEKEGAEGSQVWDATQQSPSEGNLVWHAEIKEDKLTGTLLWRKADGSLVNYTLAGAPATPEEVAAATPPGEEGEAKSGEAGKKTTEAKTGKGEKKGFGCSLKHPSF